MTAISDFVHHHYRHFNAAALVDPLGLLYRYSLAASMVPGCGKRRGGSEEGGDDT